MIQHITRSTPLFVLLLAASLVLGCDDRFYLSEAELNGYVRPIHSAAEANATFAGLQNQLLSIQFSGPTNPLQITSTNLLTVIRDGTLLPAYETVNRQIDLPRLSLELEQQLQTLVSERLNFFQGESEYVNVNQISSLTIRFKSSPTFSYDAARQSITMNLMVRMTLQATLRIHGVDSWLSLLLAGPIDGAYPMTIIMDNLVFNAEAFLEQPHSDAARIRLRATPLPNSIAVTSPNAPPNIINAVRAVLFLKLTSSVDDAFDQRYSHFRITGLKIAPPAGSMPAELSARYESNPDRARPSLHVVARGADNKLYHARKIGSAWMPFSGPLFPALNISGYTDPTLVASGNGQVELAATTTGLAGGGQVLYSQWRDGSWIGSALLASTGNRFTGKPAMVASAAGQAELFVAVQQLAGIAHLRRVNGRWQQQSSVPLPVESSSTPMVWSYSKPAAVITGNKVVVVFVNNQNRLRAAVFDMETSRWGMPAAVNTQETVQYGPLITSSGNGRVEVVYVGPSGMPHHFGITIPAGQIPAGTTSNWLYIGAEVEVGGVLSSTPVFVATGVRQLELIGRGTDLRLYSNHYVGPDSPTGFVDGRNISVGWQGWVLMPGFLNGAPLSLTADRMDSVEGIATPSGGVEIVSVGHPGSLTLDPDPYLYHNSFDANRYGRAPWKTVHWRGYERIERKIITGRPAIAATDTHFELSFIGNAGNSYHSRFTERNAGTFTATGMQSMVFPAVPDPEIHVSGPGLVDLVTVRFDTVIAHARRTNGSTTVTRMLSSGFRSRPAVVSYGHGQLDLVALNLNGSLYHWRYLNGVWSLPLTLSGAGMGTPVLKYMGAGQLELLTIASDLKLYRRRFTGGAWSAAQQLPSSFTISATSFTPHSVSSWGDGTLDVVVANSINANVYHRRVGPHDDTVAGGLFGPPARSFNFIGGVVYDAPAIVALSPTSLHIVARGSSGFFSNVSSPDIAPIIGPIIPGADLRIRWHGFRAIGGTGLYLAGVVKSGDSLVAAGLDSGSRLYINRFTSGAWSGFYPVTGLTSAMMPPLGWPLVRPALSSYGGQ